MEEIYVIHVTHKCNMKCLYCYETDKDSTYSWEEIKSYIDNLIESRTQNNFAIEFLGGEPILAWDLIQKSYEYIETDYHKIVNVSSYTITTNGTIIDENILNYLKDNKKMYYAISVDGNKWANQLRIMKKNNENSYDTVMKTIEKLQQNNLYFSVHIVVHPFNIGFLEDSVEDLYKNGVRKIGIGTVESTMKIDEKYAKSFVRRLNNISIKILTREFKDLNIDLFGGVKPLEDVRSYIKDKNGKTLGESYGRSGNDISKKDDIYNINRCDDIDDMSKLIFNMRREAYLNHQKNKSIIESKKE